MKYNPLKPLYPAFNCNARRTFKDARSYIPIALIALMACSWANASEVGLSWNPVEDSRVVGYELHYGTVRGDYASMIPSSNTEARVAGLEPGTTYYFAVKAHGDNREMDSGFSEEVSTTIAYPAPAAAFRADVVQGVAPLPVKFNCESTGPITSWHWDFGDGNSSTTQAPTHTYIEPGSYAVVLTVTGPGGTSTAGAQNVIALTPPPVANFAESVTSGVIPLTVVFRDESTGHVETNRWDFGDGGSSGGREAVWTYSVPGTYSVSMTATGQGGSDTMTKPALIQVAGIPPTVDFAADLLGGLAPLHVSFQALSSGEISAFEWDFGDGTTSNEQNPFHSYSEPGSYSITLSVSGPYGSDSEFKLDYIQVTRPELVIESGELSVDHNWQWVAFERDFVDPIVVATPPSFNEAEPAVVRIDGVTAEGFWIRVQEWDYLDGLHAPETVSFLAVERGRHQLPSGEWVEADRLNASGQGVSDRTAFTAPFASAPIVLSSIASVNLANAVTTRLNRISTTTFDVRLQQQEATMNRHGSETVHFVAWEPSTGTIDGYEFNVGRTGNVVNHNRFALAFDTAFHSAPMVLADMQTMRGLDTAALRATNITGAGLELWVEEERSLDNEVSHGLEAVGWVAFH